jgi:hypothetical protein
LLFRGPMRFTRVEGRFVAGLFLEGQFLEGRFFWEFFLGLAFF